MNHLEQAEKTAKHLNHKDTVSFIRGLKSKRVFKIKSKFPTIEGIKCEIVKSDRCFKFECDGLSSSVSPVVYQSEHYGYGDPFELVNDNERILIQNGIGKISMKLAKRFASEGEFWEVESNFRKTPCCHRAIISLDGFYKPPVEFIQSGSFRIGDSLRVAGFINLTISEYPIGFYDYNIDHRCCSHKN
ncbi:MAG TPA: hypothetical protein DIW27_00475, partial [Cytophagales bacterium]|nr:hypothetical protein [Cytophagales bacterium]